MSNNDNTQQNTEANPGSKPRKDDGISSADYEFLNLLLFSPKEDHKEGDEEFYDKNDEKNYGKDHEQGYGNSYEKGYEKGYESNDNGYYLHKIPNALHKKLYAIPDAKKRIKTNTIWSMLASAAVLVIALLIGFNTHKQAPTGEELKGARQNLAIAFSYLNTANQKAQVKVKHTISTSIRQALIGRIFKSENSNQKTL